MQSSIYGITHTYKLKTLINGTFFKLIKKISYNLAQLNKLFLVQNLRKKYESNLYTEYLIFYMSYNRVFKRFKSRNKNLFKNNFRQKIKTAYQKIN